jgi:hypothetical protein
MVGYIRPIDTNNYVRPNMEVVAYSAKKYTKSYLLAVRVKNTPGLVGWFCRKMGWSKGYTFPGTNYAVIEDVWFDFKHVVESARRGKLKVFEIASEDGFLISTDPSVGDAWWTIGLPSDIMTYGTLTGRWWFIRRFRALGPWKGEVAPPEKK